MLVLPRSGASDTEFFLARLLDLDIFRYQILQLQVVYKFLEFFSSIVAYYPVYLLLLQAVPFWLFLKTFEEVRYLVFRRLDGAPKHIQSRADRDLVLVAQHYVNVVAISKLDGAHGCLLNIVGDNKQRANDGYIHLLLFLEDQG